MIVVISVAALAVLGLAVALVLGGFPRMSVHSPAAVSSAGGRLLPDGEVRSDDVDRVRFAVALRGYRMDQVDAVMDRLHARLAELEAEIADVPPASAQVRDTDGGSSRDRRGPADDHEDGVPAGLIPFLPRRDGQHLEAADPDSGHRGDPGVGMPPDHPGEGPPAR